MIGVAHGLFMTPTLWPACDWCGAVIDAFPGDGNNHVWLTIDDGPDPHDTDEVLDVLDELDARATFFLIGERVRAHPELARRMVERGHDVGNHTMTHPERAFWAFGPGGARRELADCQAAIEDATGVSPRWFRAPVGFENPFVSAEVEKLGLRSVVWSARGYDGVNGDPQQAVRRIAPDVRSGAIILTHQRRPKTARTADAPAVLRGVLEHVRANGLVATVPDP